METCGISTAGTIDSLVPVDKDDYDNLRKLLVAKLTPNEKCPLYIGFLEELLRDLTANLEVDDIRKLSSTVNTVLNEKIKLSKVSEPCILNECSPVISSLAFGSWQSFLISDPLFSWRRARRRTKELR